MSTAAQDVAVIGLGAMGAMTLWRLARRGVPAVGVDRFVPPHELGSSHGESRIFRTAYAEGAFYVPLLEEALGLWRELEAQSGEPLLTLTGALMIGSSAGSLVGDALESARRHRLEHVLRTGKAAARSCPQHRLDLGDAVLWEPRAGVLRPEAAIAAALGCAERDGATIVLGRRAVAVESGRGGVAVRLDDGSVLRARHAVVAAGAWTGVLVPSLRAALRVERQVLAWFPIDDPGAFAPERFPVFIRELPDGRLRYGLPSLDGATVKLAVHHEGETADPEALRRSVDAADLAPIAELATGWLRGVGPAAVRSVVCMYTNTPDEHLIVGPAPAMPGVTVVGGCSGHSFKLASVLGDVAAELAVTGATRRDVAALDPTRPALRQAHR